MENSFEMVNGQEVVDSCKEEENSTQGNDGEGSSKDSPENANSSSESTQSESLFTGENQIYPSRRNAANIEHQNQVSESKNAANLPANIQSSSSTSDAQPVSETAAVENEKNAKVQRRATVEPTTKKVEEKPKTNRTKSEEAKPTKSETKNEQAEQSAESSQCSSSSSSPEEKSDKTNNETVNRPVNILPVNRNLVVSDNLNNLIAIGRKPQTQKVKTTVQKKKADTVSNSTEKQSKIGWQEDKKTLKERIAHMYCNETLSDVFFVVGNDDARQTIPAHKFVLSIGSVVFDAMFNGGLTPKNTDEPLEIELPDVEPPAFLALLNFLYTDEVDIGPESVMTTLYTAKKYAVRAVETACVDFLKQSLSADNAFMLLAQAKFFDEPQLEQQCLEQIDRSTIEALNGDGFTEIDLSVLCDVLSRDTLRINELHLFQATLRWSMAECTRRGMPCTPENKRAVLGHAIQLIRFPLMKIDEFALNVEPTMLLSDREMNKIFKYLAVNSTDRPALVYSDRPRCSLSITESVVSRFQRTENRWGYCGASDRIKFTVDRRIFVVALGLYGAVHGPHEFKTQIKIIHCGTGKILAEHDTSFVCDGTPKPCRACFKEPVEILSGVTYIASATLTGPDSYYGTKGLRRVVTTESDVTFQFTYAAMNNNGTSVEDGQIPQIVFYTAQS